MKLRNKKTGEIIEGKCFTDIVKKLHDRGDPICSGPLLSIALFEQYWKEIDEYKQAEPLIKDEKIRKAIRAWAEACGADDADIVRHYGAERWIGLRYENPNTGWVSKFEVDGFGSCNQLGNGKVYTIAELCGEEEE